MVKESILAKVVESISAQAEKMGEYSVTLILLVALFLLGYILGTFAAKVLQKMLRIERVEDAIIKYGVMKASAWERTINFFGVYVKWFVIVSMLTLSGVSLIVQKLYPFMNNLLWFIVVLVLGLIAGGVASKFIKDISMDFGWDEKLVKYGLADALGEISITSFLAGIVKWYIVLIFVLQGVQRLESFSVLELYMGKLIAYIPGALVGVIIMVLSLMIADYTGDRLKQKKVGYAETLALGAEAVIVFFGLVLALPHFGVMNVSILEDSFKILMAGIALGIAIALGLGLKDSVSRALQK